MARVPARMYRKITQYPYTRREFMGGVPGNRIIHYHAGNPKATFPIALHLVVEEQLQIRHSALEAMRITAVRYMDKKAGRDNYHLHVRVFPHHVLRQNKQASGAGADRVSMGMRLAFGKPIGTAARVAKNQQVLTIHTVPAAIDHAKEALRKCMNKIAPPCHIDLEAEGDMTIEQMLHEAEEAHGAALRGAGVSSEPEPEATEAAEGEEAEGEEGEEGDEKDAKADKDPKAEKGAKKDKEQD